MPIIQFFKDLLNLGPDNSRWNDEVNTSEETGDNTNSTYPLPDFPPPIPTDLSSQKFPQKQLVAGVEVLLPEILEESKKYGSVFQIFIAIAFMEPIEDTPAKFFFTLESREKATKIILEWAQAYQDNNYMLPPLMATVHWGFTPIIW